MKIQEEWRFEDLPAAAQKHLTSLTVVKDEKQYRDAMVSNAANGSTDDLFALTETAQVDRGEGYRGNLEQRPMIWGTDNYSERGEGYGFHDDVKDFTIIRPRTEKTLAEQKKRVKEKAEVFTPSWVCNMQNNLIDGATPLGENAINIPSEDNKTWVSTPRIPFTEEYPWSTYVGERRLEMCCGEGPYLFSRYDTTTGMQIPVRTITVQGESAVSNWERVGLLDRKLRAVTENIDTLPEWLTAAKYALRATYGYEWQGDNLFLARMNMLNTFFDYYHDFIDNNAGVKPLTKAQVKKLLVEICEIIAGQLWQMDGLKMVLPDSCSEGCVPCAKKQRLGHDGVKPAFPWGSGHLTFEEMYYRNGGK